jgi:hypothetical protein
MIDDPIIHIFLPNRPEIFQYNYSKPIKLSNSNVIAKYRRFPPLNIPSSKTDQLANTTKLVINSCNNRVICPVKNMINYLNARPKIQGALKTDTTW